MFNLYPYLNVNDLNLDWIIKHFKEFIDEISNLEDWRREHEQEYAELKKFMDDVEAGKLPPATYERLRTWIYDNAADLMGEVVKMVFFGITDDGYFYADIPSGWNEIIFNTTGLDINIVGVEYGHLVLTY